MLAEGQDNFSILSIYSGGFNWGQDCTSKQQGDSDPVYVMYNSNIHTGHAFMKECHLLRENFLLKHAISLCECKSRNYVVDMSTIYNTAS